MCIVDPMHNLYLGTAKHMIETWKSLKIITQEDFSTMQERVNSFTTPNDMGRIPSQISSIFSGFTAEQFKNWTINFSLFALKGILPWQHYNCWLLYVKACCLISQRSISQAKIDEADDLILKFCQAFVQLYGIERCTPNIHLHNHLKACIEDYDPVYAFWLFSFERLNGIMGSYHTKGKSISLQLTRRFLDSKDFGPFNWPDFKDDFPPLLERYQYNKGSLMQTTFDGEVACLGSIRPLPPFQENSFARHDCISLTNLLHTVLQQPISLIDVFILYQQTNAVIVNNSVIAARKSRYFKSSFVLTKTHEDSEVSMAVLTYRN